MAKPMKTPGVYIVEKDAFPNSIVEVETAVPVFIGHTKKAEYRGSSLKEKPTQVTSLNEYHDYFGFGPQSSFEFGPTSEEDAKDAYIPGIMHGGESYSLTNQTQDYLLYASMQMFFSNGGGKCFIISVGDYNDALDAAKFQAAVLLLLKEQLPTMIVVPDAVRLKDIGEWKKVQDACLAHCEKMMNRITIVDVFEGYKDFNKPGDDVIAEFRNNIGDVALKYATTYYPWIETNIYSDRQVGLEHLRDPSDDPTQPVYTKTNLVELLKKEVDEQRGEGTSEKPPFAKLFTDVESVQYSEKELGSLTAAQSEELEMLNNAIRTMSPLYKILIGKVKTALNTLPPAAAMAGVYTRIDSNRGVWKAPANTSISGAMRPVVNISHDEQEELNVDTMGKSVNAIREFINEGTLVWGARTLDGNSLDWRYINVRRTMIMLEESVRLASKAYVFEPNTANTWVTMRSMISNFLTGIWKRGGLAGAVPSDAFSVHVGLGETMTPEDILEGILRITVLVAPTRPAEFIEITFQQQQQKS